jgi:hypothetical protein
MAVAVVLVNCVCPDSRVNMIQPEPRSGLEIVAPNVLVCRAKYDQSCEYKL